MIRMPDYYDRVDSLPDDPENSIPMCAQTSNAGIFTIQFPISPSESMPFDNTLAVIDGIHRALSDRQGLIEVDNGTTSRGSKYIYSIVKTLKEPHGVQYTLTYQLKTDDGEVINLQGFFDEIGVTGSRDTAVFSALMSDGKIDADMKGWAEDPYDPEYTNGILMNLSEKESVDEVFPEHPLSMTRELVRFIGENN